MSPFQLGLGVREFTWLELDKEAPPKTARGF